jgi:hypothetical protein
VRWRLADVLSAQGKSGEAESHMQSARSGFESLLARHLLAFADHGAELYAGSGNDCRRALELARVNLANRPTLRAFEQAYSIAVASGAMEDASEFLAQVNRHWGGTAAFRASPLAKHCLDRLEGAAA